MNEAATFDGPAVSAATVVRGLDVRSIAKSYDKRTVLHDVSLHVERGEVVGLLGPNGAGKTTSFYSVMGLVKPDAGRIFDWVAMTNVNAAGSSRSGVCM